MLRFCIEVIDGTPKAELAMLKFQISDLRSEISELIPLAESCSRQIRGWADTLQNSAIKGQRHLNDKSKRAFDADKRAKAFHDQIEQSLREAHPEWFPQR